jgi:hypothetical protein
LLSVAAALTHRLRIGKQQRTVPTAIEELSSRRRKKRWRRRRRRRRKRKRRNLPLLLRVSHYQN